MCPRNLALCFFCLLLLASGQLALPLVADSQTQSIGMLLKQAEMNLTRLELRLKERKTEVLNLQAELMRLSKDLTEARRLLAESQADLTETRNLLDSLSERYDLLLTAYNRLVRKNKIELWIWRGATALASGLFIISASK